MAPVPSLPPELHGNIATHLDPIPRASFFRALKGLVQFPRPATSTANIWDLIFKDDKWVNKVLRTQNAPHRNPTVSLIGKDLEKLYYRGRNKPSYLVLAIHDWTGDVQCFQDMFFKSLQEHHYNKARSEIYLSKPRITLHMRDAVISDEWVYMPDPTRMFRLRRGKLSTNAIYYTDDALQNIGPELIGGIRDWSVKKKRAVSEICSIKAKFRDGTPVYRVFVSASKKARVVHIKSTDEMGVEWITQWRLAQPHEREWGHNYGST